MKITYITTYDANELSNWSGLGYYIAQSLLKQENELEFLGKLERKISPALFLKAIYYRKIVQQGFPLDRSPHVIKAYARQIARRLNYHTDLLFSPGSIAIALLETKKPKVFYTDATFAGMLGFYAAYSNLSKEATRNGNMLEQQALDSAALAIYSSDWAAQSAIRDYNANPDKVKVVPFGANLDTAFSYETIKSILLNRPQTTCHLLFIAVDWERKGGDIAVQVARELNTNGIHTVLHIVGINEFPAGPPPDFVRLHGHVSKATAAGKKIFQQLFEQAHFLLLPTKADCTPIVFSEANSFGIPCLSTDVGGISTVLKDAINGRIFSLTDQATEYAGFIQSYFTNQAAYRNLCLSSYNEFQTRLNWDVAGSTITRYLRELI